MLRKTFIFFLALSLIFSFAPIVKAKNLKWKSYHKTLKLMHNYSADPDDPQSTIILLQIQFLAETENADYTKGKFVILSPLGKEILKGNCQTYESDNNAHIVLKSKKGEIVFELGNKAYTLGSTFQPYEIFYFNLVKNTTPFHLPEFFFTPSETSD